MMLRSVLLFFASLLLLSIFSLSIFSSSTTSQENYPPEYVEDYVKECTGDQDLSIEAVCRCVVRKSQSEYSLEDFKKINQESEATGEIPKKLLQIIDDCTQDPFS